MPPNQGSCISPYSPFQPAHTPRGPEGWESDELLHKFVYGTAWRALRGSSYGEALDRMRFGAE